MKNNNHPGQAFPLGATPTADGVNFSLFSDHADAVELLLFKRVSDAKPSQVITLDPGPNRTHHYWHTFVPGLKSGQIYAYRATGPYAPEHGLRFRPEKVLFDPYGRALAMPPDYNREAATEPGDNAEVALKSVVVDPDL